MPSLTPQQSGALLRLRREERGLTQAQVVERTTVPTVTQLSQYELGRVNVARSKHLAALAVVLGLSEADLRALNPAAVFTRPDDREPEVSFKVATPDTIRVPYWALSSALLPTQGRAAEGHHALLAKDHDPQHVLMRVDSDAMEPGIAVGDFVAVDPADLVISPGRIYAVEMEGRVVLMRAHADAFQRLYLQASNHAYRPANADMVTVHGRATRHFPQSATL